MDNSIQNALKWIYASLGGDITDLAKVDDITTILNAIAGLDTVKKISEATELPVVTSEDNGDVLTVVEGAWAKAAPGGGGDSDFSTAEITIVNNTRTNPPSTIPVVLDDGDRGALMGTAGSVQSGTITTALYKGMLMFLNPFAETEPAPVINTTGDAVFNDGLFMVTGDCTITFSIDDGPVE